MMFGLVGVVVRVILRVFIRTTITSFSRSKGNDAVVQGIGMIIAGSALAVVSFFFFFPIVFGSLYIFSLDGVLCLGLVVSGIGRLVSGLFTFHESVESRSGPAASPVNYYVALPEEMPVGYCWQCGRPVKHDSLICLRCGATHPKGAQHRAMLSAPTLERDDSGQWPQWQEQEQEEDDPLRRLGPGPMGPGRFPGKGPHPPGAPYPPRGAYPPGAPYPPYPPQNMPYPGPGFPPYPMPSQPMRRPPPGGPYPGAPFPPNQQQPGRGRPPRGRPPRERPPQERLPREKKPSRPRWGR